MNKAARADAWPSTVLVKKESAIAKELTPDHPQSLSARNQPSPKSWHLTFQSSRLQGISYRQSAHAWPSRVLVCKESAITKELTPDLPQSSSARNWLSPATELECWHYRNTSLYSLSLEFVTALKSGTWKRSLIVWYMKETIKYDTGLLATSTVLVCKGLATANNRAKMQTLLQHFCMV